MADGRLCRAPALRGERFCLMHDPAHADEVAEGRRLGGARRRRERTLASAYELTSVRTIDDLLRVVEIAICDLLGLETSIAKARALLHGAMVGGSLIKTNEYETRLEALERAEAGRAAEPTDLDGTLLGGP
ncbi:MAG: hypothetical protein ACYDAK_13470 [Candidatus Limnocylindrales bacterium]